MVTRRSSRKAPIKPVPKLPTSGPSCPTSVAFSDAVGVDIDEEILARIRAAGVWDKDAKVDDYQVRACENGYVLVNLRTGRAQLIYDALSKLRDWEQLFPKDH